MMKTALGVKKTTHPPQVHTIPEILRPDNHHRIEASPLLIQWKANQTKVVKWWLSVGHAPGLDDYFSDEYGPDDELSERVKIDLTGGDVYILLEYQDADGNFGSVRPIVECSTRDTTQHPTHTHHEHA
jgi:hypothetical protein